MRYLWAKLSRFFIWTLPLPCGIFVLWQFGRKKRPFNDGVPFAEVSAFSIANALQTEKKTSGASLCWVRMSKRKDCCQLLPTDGWKGARAGCAEGPLSANENAHFPLLNTTSFIWHIP